MARQSRFKHKLDGKWVYTNELAELREADRAKKEIPNINLKFLPSVEVLEEVDEDEVNPKKH